ncbi:hypothetical protein IFT84_17580 [Rhizobium sp. CFBP 8762]|uniref:hypothetical protein n=1 Tax=Rhizobium sp. CFBP 8762 TaxID=2775279 RepID=UPI0017806FF6|nr:hypothetical protein [Rhizobium sp. CFBP 8762]MBD8556322.1 hypothetical protein [Rhizobium sp. CFBP 8762]
MKKSKISSPNFANANRIKLPECHATADTIVQMMVEGYRDGFTANQRAKQADRRESGVKV